MIVLVADTISPWAVPAFVAILPDFFAAGWRFPHGNRTQHKTDDSDYQRCFFKHEKHLHCVVFPLVTFLPRSDRFHETHEKQ
jgi:hypothetical protein